MPLRSVLVLSGLALALAVPAAAQISCGDTLGPGGKFIAAGPIGPCAQDPALTIVGPVKVDLAGYELSCQLNSSDGVLIQGKGATVENGSVANCDHGFLIQGEGKHKLTRLVSRNQASEGFRIAPDTDGNKLKECVAAFGQGEGFYFEQSDKNSLTGCRSARNLNTGFFFDGSDGNKMKDCTSVADGEGGVRLSGQGNKLAKIAVAESGINGVEINGDDNSLKDVTSTYNASSGFFLQNGQGNTLKACTAIANGSRGFAVGAGTVETKISKCRAVRSGAEGVQVQDGAQASAIDKCVALHNTAEDLEDLNAGCGTTTWKKNTFGTSDPAPGGCIQ